MKFATKYLENDYDILEMGFAHANHRLKQQIIYNMAEKSRLNMCFKCGQKIRSVEDLSIEHINGWNNEQELLDINNISISHLHCNCGASNAGSGKLAKQYGYIGINKFVDKRKDYVKYRAWARCGPNKKKKTICYANTPLEAAIGYDIGGMRCRQGELVLNFPSLREYYQKILSYYPPESESTIFYKRGPIKDLIKKTIAENPGVFQDS